MSNDNEKNINLTLVQNEDNDNSVILSFSSIFKCMKKMLALWIVISVICGLITTSVAIFVHKTVQTDTITSLVSFNYSGIESGLAPDGTKFDVNKIKAPNVIETALSNLEIPLDSVEKVRRNIKITGIIPNEIVDKLSLYNGLVSEGGSSALQAVEELLATEYNASYYILEFDNTTAEFDIETGKKIIDEILNAYKSSFFTEYGYNKALGNSIAMVDYKEYDYPAAIDIFKLLLDDLEVYIRNLKNSNNVEFRSTATGYSFDDILRDIDVIRNADLNSLSTYITINNITNDKEQLVTYYNYKIEELQREANVIQTELNSISNSIDAYEKDSLLIFGDSNAMEDTEYTQTSEKYDELIEEKISVQQQYSQKMQNIAYYKLRLETFSSNKAKNNGNIEYVEERFAVLYEKINNIVDITTKSTDEYYENVVFANAFNILVPAIGDDLVVEITGVVIPIILIEVVLFVLYIGYSFVYAIVLENKNKRDVKTEENK